MSRASWYNHQHFRTFYLIARYGGISASLKYFGYGVQQPAISEQMLKLEEVLRVRLFERQPFRLLPAGRMLYDYIRPYHDGLAEVLGRIAATDGAPSLRVAAADVVLAEFLPAIVDRLLAESPGLRIEFSGGTVADRIDRLRHGETDFVIAATGRPPAGLASRRLLRLPLVLAVGRSASLPADPRRWPQPLPRLVVPADPPEIAEVFEAGLAAWNLRWESKLAVPTVEHAGWFARSGAVGLTLDLPTFTRKHGLRALRVPEAISPPVEVFALWREPATEPVRKFLAAVEIAAAALTRRRRGAGSGEAVKR